MNGEVVVTRHARVEVILRAEAAVKFVSASVGAIHARSGHGDRL